LAIEWGLGRAVDVAVNHDREAVAMHTVNHPWTRHYCEDVWTIDPVEVCKGRPVGLAWFSPDCKHFSKAKGGKPVSRRVRGLAWVVIRWAWKVRPRVIMLENVEEFQDWGPLVAVCDKNGKKQLDSDGKDIMMPCGINKGKTFYQWVSRLEKLGYLVEWKELRACDYGAPTIRKRLFLVARCDGLPIVWPDKSHGDAKSDDVLGGRLLPWKTAADCIDWSIPCPSIFERERPLADATLRRIAKGIMKYVVNNPEPFIVTYYGDKGGEFRGQSMDEPLATQTTENRHALVVPVFTEHANASSPRCMPADEPLRTICANVKGGHHALVSAFLAKNYTGVVGSNMGNCMGTVTAIDHHSLVTANMIRHYGNSDSAAINRPSCTVTGKNKDSVVTAHLVRQFGQSVGSSPDNPVGTVTSGGLGKTGLVTSHMVKLRGTCRDGQAITRPMPTITASGTHIGEVRAFLLKYYGNGTEHGIDKPLGTVTAKDRFGLVMIRGEQYQIADIGLRMMSPRELFRAQGFPDEYIIDPVVNGKALTKTAQVRMCGNSVSPFPAAALVRENVKISSGARMVA